MHENRQTFVDYVFVLKMEPVMRGEARGRWGRLLLAWAGTGPMGSPQFWQFLLSQQIWLYNYISSEEIIACFVASPDSPEQSSMLTPK